MEVADSNETYKLPGEIYMAINTGREVFLEMLKNRIDKEPLDRDAQKEIITLLRDLIVDRANDRQRIQQLENTIKDMKLNADGLSTQLTKMSQTLKEIA